MEVKAIYRNARMSPRKIRPLGHILKGLSVQDADVQLKFTPGKAAAILRQTLKSAVANAVNNFELEATNLLVGEVLIDKGIVFKRFFPAPKGMAHEILKRNAHVAIIVKEKEVSDKPKKLSRKKTQIETFSVQEYATQTLAEDHEHSEHDHKEKDPGKRAAAQAAAHQPTIAEVRGKEYEASEKMRANQQGGNPKKTGRRKSLAK